MVEICKILTWMCGFIIASAIGQLVSPLNFSLSVVAVATAVIYLVGKQQNSLPLQIIAFGLIFGWLRCFFLG